MLLVEKGGYLNGKAMTRRKCFGNEETWAAVESEVSNDEGGLAALGLSSSTGLPSPSTSSSLHLTLGDLCC